MLTGPHWDWNLLSEQALHGRECLEGRHGGSLNLGAAWVLASCAGLLLAACCPLLPPAWAFHSLTRMSNSTFSPLSHVGRVGTGDPAEAPFLGQSVMGSSLPSSFLIPGGLSKTSSPTPVPLRCFLQPSQQRSPPPLFNTLLTQFTLYWATEDLAFFFFQLRLNVHNIKFTISYHIVPSI